MRSERPAAGLLALLGLAVYAGAWRATGFIRDDRYIILGNGLLSAWRWLPRLLTTGYWESALGTGAPVAEYRPLLMLSYFLNMRLLGRSSAAFHLVNAALHAGAVALVFFALRRRFSAFAAASAAALFAVLPVHTEAVAYISGRSEILVAIFLLLCWLDVEGSAGKPRRGLLWYALAVLSKEQAVVFPVFLAADDWVRGGRKAFTKDRRALYAGLLLLTAGYLLLRDFVLPDPFHGGYDYFTGVPLLSQALTVARFFCVHYLAPLGTGLGLSSDYSRPLIPDSPPSDAIAWLCLAAWLSAAAWAVRDVYRRRKGGLLFWLFALPLAPTAHVLIKLDTIGAERFLYLPSIAFCALLGWGLERLPKNARLAAVTVLCLAYAGLAAARAQIWFDEDRYYDAAIKENPVSAGARSGYGVQLALKGQAEAAKASFLKAVELNPRYPGADFNLGRLAYDQGNFDEADDHLKLALQKGLVDSDALILRGLIAERRKEPQRAAQFYLAAIAVKPWHPLAHFDLGRLLLASGKPAAAALEFRRYLSLDPQADDAAQISALCAKLDPAPRSP